VFGQIGEEVFYGGRWGLEIISTGGFEWQHRYGSVR
jgi:hypothetical protein